MHEDTPTDADTTATVTVSHDGLGGTGAWSVTIDGDELRGREQDRRVAEAALHNVPEAGGVVVVPGCGSIPVPHRAAGRVSSLALADLAMVPGGDSVTLTVHPTDPLDT